MGKFVKAKSEQAFFKVALYGKTGSGKTLTSLLWAEGLAAREGKRVAFVDTERGIQRQDSCKWRAADRGMAADQEAIQAADVPFPGRVLPRDPVRP